MSGARVAALARDARHEFSKTPLTALDVLAGHGVIGDAHAGATVQHRSRVKIDPTQPNLRQVHLIHAELLEELRAQGFTVGAGDLGENILTAGIDLLGLPRGTRLQLGPEATLELTGLRNPCAQIERFQPGLLAAVLERTPSGELIRKAGVMAIVLTSGRIAVGDPIAVILPCHPHQPLGVV